MNNITKDNNKDKSLKDNNLKVTIEKLEDGTLYTTSNRVAEELEVRHDHLLDKIDSYIKLFSSPELSGQFYIPSEYKTLNNRTSRNYLITEKGVAQLVGGYSAAVPKAFGLNVAYINEFDRMKKELNKPLSTKEILLMALRAEEEKERLQQQSEQQQMRIAELSPKAEYCEKVLKSDELLPIKKIALDYGMTAIELNKLLNKLKIQYKQGGNWYLYKEHQGQGYTQTKTYHYEHSDGTDGTRTHLYWTQLGRIFMYEELRRIGILPLSERNKVMEWEL